MLTKKHAEDIAKKLHAEIRHKKAHDLAVVEYNGQRVLQFGIRRGSRNDSGHDHLPNNLHLHPRDALLLAQCPLSREEWLRRMKEKGLITDDEKG
ncbi:MAG TPA: hypothetical protein VJH03_08570 [Blastocatellia bacterium]|nr:hypothetical protein [Blastocatellia bacterium]